MKARLATALSIAGVVATGGAAFAMNSSLLDTEPAAQGSAALATVVAVDATTSLPVSPSAPGSALVVSAGAIAETITATSAPSKQAPPRNGTEMLKPLALPTETTAAPTAPAPSTSAAINTPSPSTTTPIVRQFNVEDFASIYLVVNGAQLGIDRISVTPGSPFVVSNRYVSGDTVRITLTSPARTVEFSARMSNGEIVAAISDPTSALLPPPRHHDDDDDHEDDDHEEREHEEHEHDREDDDD